jgi:hypothetical protein
MEQSMPLTAIALLLVAGMTTAGSAGADFELTGPDGRRLLLKDDGTWKYLQEKGKAVDAPTSDGVAILVLERMGPRGNGCQLAVRLENKLPYEIRSLVPYYSVYRADDVIYDTSSGGQGFSSIRPGDTQSRQVEFQGIPCSEIRRVRIVGGGRCQMGDLDRFSATPEQCLARVRVVGSDLVRFEK